MTLDEIKAALEAKGYQIQQEQRTGNDKGTQLRLANGAIVNAWDNGNHNVQGKNVAEVNEALSAETEGKLRGQPLE
jgi:predicted nucleotide-binding protein